MSQNDVKDLNTIPYGRLGHYRYGQLRRSGEESG